MISKNNNGGTNQIRTGDEGFADPSLTSWRWCHIDYIIIYEKKENCNIFYKSFFIFEKNKISLAETKLIFE